MTRRIALAAVVVAVVAVVLAVLPTAARAQNAGDLTPAQLTLSRCVQTSRALDVLFLVDESGSLRTSDPDGGRVDGLKAALAGFKAVADTAVGGSNAVVNVRFLGFSGALRPDPEKERTSWRPLDSGSFSGLLDEAEAFRERDGLRDTDYALALGTARTLLAQRAGDATRDGGTVPCQVLVWFTDGGYRLLDRTPPYAGDLPREMPYAPGVDLATKGGGARAVEAGKDYLCKPDGVMDALVSDGVVRFTISLKGIDDYLRSLTDGNDCGTRLSPASGDLLGVDDADCLFFVFGNLLAGTGCPGPGDTQATFKTIAGLRRFVIRATTGGPDVGLTLTAPNGESLTLPPGNNERHTLAGTKIAPVWTSGSAVVVTGEFDRAARGWVGDWRYAFSGGRPTGPPRSTVQLQADLTPELLGRPTVPRGGSATVRFGLFDGSGKQVEGGPLADAARPSAQIADPAAATTTAASAVRRAGDGSWRVPISIPEDSQATAVLVDVDVPFELPGVPVDAVHRTFEISVVVPKGQGFPTVAPAELELPSVEDVGDTSGELQVTGSAESSGCVWIDPPRGVVLDPPATSEARCLVVQKGGHETIKVTLHADGSRVGTIRTPLPIHLRSDLVDRAQTVKVEASYVAFPKANVPLRWLVVIATMLAAVAIPVGILWGLNWWAGRFTPPQQVLRMSKPVVALGGDGAAPTALYREFEPISLTGRDRSVRTITLHADDGADIALNSIARLRDLFVGPRGRAAVKDEWVIAGTASRRDLARWGRRHEIPLALPDTWLFVAQPPLLDDHGNVERVTGKLTLLIGDGDIDWGERLLREALDALQEHDWDRFAAEVRAADEPSRLDRLRERLRSRWRRLRVPESTGPVDSLDDFDDDFQSPAAGRASAESHIGSDRSEIDLADDNPSRPRGGADF